jgi:hypothetical protein
VGPTNGYDKLITWFHGVTMEALGRFVWETGVKTTTPREDGGNSFEIIPGMRRFADFMLDLDRAQYFKRFPDRPRVLVGRQEGAGNVLRRNLSSVDILRPAVAPAKGSGGEAPAGASQLVDGAAWAYLLTGDPAYLAGARALARDSYPYYLFLPAMADAVGASSAQNQIVSAYMPQFPGSMTKELGWVSRSGFVWQAAELQAAR